MPDDVLIYPALRALVAKLATWAAGLALLCALSALAELLLAPVGLVGVALFCGSLSELLMSLLQPLVIWVGLWCHMVLLAGRGMELTRYGLLTVAVLALMMPVCTLYLLLVDEPLLLRQAELPLICNVVLAVCVLLNLPRGTAAGWWRLVLLSAYAIMAVFYSLTNMPELVWLSDICKIAACAAIYYPLRALSRYAPRVVSLPELD